ncbi:hypothetical protein Bcav_2190 [Beutenbergia cavernae DSM 12333]|uniref:DUF4386 family protein n=1 Tax=Beutenbergia cavernae (strain ATCC BAA-8 / DSM 12333 / CCUG 43141 / JCM 11478 / NBRC 16432 / NCIMB 13614 / HKI 0122) TaxID=471853 RepID=C5BV55_BEUC1|nr:hypothetical protein [Beutenbergia cavernae]ACQ80442.1 hypothetical protein Bcav_2190 [Beutenbergia cavernae DSM 12333]
MQMSSDVPVALQPARPPLRTTGRALIAAALLYVMHVVFNQTTSALLAIPEHMLPSDLPELRWSSSLLYVINVAWYLAVLVAVASATQLPWAVRTTAGRAAAAAGFLSVGAGVLGAAMGLGLHGGAAEAIGSGGDVPPDTLRAVVDSLYVPVNGAVFAANVLLATWLVGLAVVARRAAVLGAGHVVVATSLAVVALTADVVVGFPVGVLVLMLWVGIVGVLLVRRARRTEVVSPAPPVAVRP